MKKVFAKFLLAVLIIAMAVSVFVACETKESYSVSFVDDSGNSTDAMTAVEAQEYFKSLPTREGYVFKGWYLDKDVWQQEIKSTEDIEKYIVNGKVNVYARWLPIVDAITILFLDYNKASLLEYSCDRSDVNLNFIKPSTKPNDEKYTYTFDHWDCDMSDLTQPFYTATPVYTANLRVFEVKYFDDDGELIYTEQVKYGKDAKTGRINPEKKPSTVKYDYTFVGWDGVATNVTSDVNLKAKYQKTLRRYNVTFNYGDNKTETKKVAYGSSAVAPTNTQKSDSAQYKYSFVGWDNSLDNIQEDTVINARYSEEIRIYEVSFWVDDKCIQSTKVPYGESATEPTTVVKELNDGYIYTFSGWDKSFNRITGNTKINANFECESQTFEVKYFNWDGELLCTDRVETGDESVYPAEKGTPTRDNTAKYEYTFQGWTNGDKLKDVRSDLAVTANFKETIRSYTVTFKYGDDLEEEHSVKYGSRTFPPSGENLIKTNTPQYEYEFDQWDNDGYNNVKSDITVTALYKKKIRSYKVTFVIEGTEEIIKTTYVNYGESATAPDSSIVVKKTTDGFTYTFKEWDKSFDSIEADTKVTALFDQHSHTYEVKYVNWDGTLLYTDRVESSEPSVYPSTDAPQREPNDKYEYEFNGWMDKEGNSAKDKLKCVTESFAVYANYTWQIRKYTVTFLYGHNLKKELTGIAYGTNLIDSDEVPTREEVYKTSTNQYDFTFIDWDKYMGCVSSNMEINAIYKETIRKYIVKFINNGSVVKSQEVEYGSCPTAPSDLVSKTNTEQWKYTYLGWEIADTDFVDSQESFVGVDPNTSVVEDEIVYTAIYLRAIQRYFVKFFNDEGDKVAMAEIEVDYGTNVIAENLAPTPFKESVPKYDFEFAEWSKDLTFIKSDIEVYAKYNGLIRSYIVTFKNGDDVYEEFTVEYGSASPKPEKDPTKPSTVQFDFVFLGWDGLLSYVEGDTIVTANYRNDLRYYMVKYFNLATYEFIETVEMGYGSSISKTIKRDGYDFDSWYKDPDCNTVFNMEEDTVDGTMMLFGNTVMQGILFNDNNEIIGYEGTQPNLIIPIAANGRKVSTIKENAFKDNTVIGSVYIPSTITKVEAYAFSGLVLTESGGIYVQSKKAWGSATRPSGWSEYWNRNSLTSFRESDRPVTYNVDGIYTVGDFQYILIADGDASKGKLNTAIVDRFINNTTAKAYIADQFDHHKPYFVSVVETDEKTEIQRNVYDIEYTINTYQITKVAVSAFEGCSNVVSIFIPDTIEKVGNYAFSGVTANIYIQRSKPVGSEIPTGWGIYWNSNRKGQEGERTLYWGVIDMARVGDYSYIFMSNNTAIAVEYNGSTTATSVDVPGSVTFKDVNYTVTELGDELFANMTLLNTVTLNEGLEKIKSKVFYMDAMLATVKLPSTLKEIGDYAFLGALALKEIYIPAAVKTMGMLIFVGMENLTIYCGVAKEPTYLPGISGYNPLWDVKIGLSDLGDLTNLKGIAGTLVNPNHHTVIYNVAAIYIDTAKETGRETKFKYVLFNNNTAKVISSSNTILNVETYEMPSTITYNETTYTVTAIGAEAFAGNTTIKNLIIPSTVTSIEANAFQGCSKLTIKTEHASVPSGWDSNFNPDGRPVECGYVATQTTGEDVE